MSYLEVPPYIALAHELEHVLNRLELFEQSMSRDVFINGCKQGLKELQKTSLCSIDALIINGFINNEDIVMEKTSVSSYLEFIGYIMQKKIKNAIDMQFLLNAIIRRDVSFFLAKRIPIEEQLVKDSFENLDELSVILGSFHETTLGPCFLGETIFMREHYKAINEQLHFWCWSHSLFEKKVSGPFEPNNESKFNCNIVCKLLSSLNFIKIKPKKQQDTISLYLNQAWRIQNVSYGTEDKRDLIIVQQDSQFHNIELANLKMNKTDITIKTCEKILFGEKHQSKKANIPGKKDMVNVDEGQFCLFTLSNLKKQNLFFSKSGKNTVIYSENLHIESISLPLNIEKLVDKGSVFSIEQGKIVKVGETIDLLFKPFEPEIENEIVIEGARIQLRNVAADGNCGVWALLQALYPEQNFISPTEELDLHMYRFRNGVANLIRNNEAARERIMFQATSASDLDHWLYTDDFRYFAQALGRPIGIIVYGDGYRIYEPNANEPNGNEIVYNNINDFRAYLKQHSGMPILCLAGNHYQAVINIKDLSLSTWLQK